MLVSDVSPAERADVDRNASADLEFADHGVRDARSGPAERDPVTADVSVDECEEHLFQSDRSFPSPDSDKEDAERETSTMAEPEEDLGSVNVPGAGLVQGSHSSPTASERDIQAEDRVGDENDESDDDESVCLPVYPKRSQRNKNPEVDARRTISCLNTTLDSDLHKNLDQDSDESRSGEWTRPPELCNTPAAASLIMPGPEQTRPAASSVAVNSETSTIDTSLPRDAERNLRPRQCRATAEPKVPSASTSTAPDNTTPPHTTETSRGQNKGKKKKKRVKYIDFEQLSREAHAYSHRRKAFSV